MAPQRIGDPLARIVGPEDTLDRMALLLGVLVDDQPHFAVAAGPKIDEIVLDILTGFVRKRIGPSTNQLHPRAVPARPQTEGPDRRSPSTRPCRSAGPTFHAPRPRPCRRPCPPSLSPHTLSAD